jgi:hypothetical protein
MCAMLMHTSAYYWTWVSPDPSSSYEAAVCCLIHGEHVPCTRSSGGPDTRASDLLAGSHRCLHVPKDDGVSERKRAHMGGARRACPKSGLTLLESAERCWMACIVSGDLLNLF